MKWILNSNQKYRSRLATLNLLPLSLRVEVQNCLLLLSIIWADNDVDIKIIRYLDNEDEEAVKTPRQTERVEYRVTKSRINKTNNNVFRRTKLVFNHVSRVANDYKKTLSNYFTENILEFCHKSLCGWEQMHMKSDLQM